MSPYKVCWWWNIRKKRKIMTQKGNKNTSSYSRPLPTVKLPPFTQIILGLHRI